MYSYCNKVLAEIVILTVIILLASHFKNALSVHSSEIVVTRGGVSNQPAQKPQSTALRPNRLQYVIVMSGTLFKYKKKPNVNSCPNDV